MSNNVRNVTKQLLGAEDVAFGRGVVQQNRGGALVPIHKLDLDLPVADEAELATTSPTEYPKASIGSRLFVAVNGQYQELSNIVPVLYRVGGALSAEYPYCINGDTIAKWTGAFPKTLTSEDVDFSPVGWEIYTVGSSRTIVSETQPPISYGKQGFNWYNPVVPAMYIYYTDGDSGQWIEEAAQGIDGALRSDLGAVDSTVPIAGVLAKDLVTVYRSIVNVKEFGATGDGTTDDSSAVQAAIDYIESNVLYNLDSGREGYGATLFFPPGRYVLQGIEVSKFNIELLGVKGATHLVNKQTTGKMLYVAYAGGTNTISGIYLTNLQIRNTVDRADNAGPIVDMDKPVRGAIRSCHFISSDFNFGSRVNKQGDLLRITAPFEFKIDSESIFYGAKGIALDLVSGPQSDSVEIDAIFSYNAVALTIFRGAGGSGNNNFKLSGKILGFQGGTFAGNYDSYAETTVVSKPAANQVEVASASNILVGSAIVVGNTNAMDIAIVKSIAANVLTLDRDTTLGTGNIVVSGRFGAVCSEVRNLNLAQIQLEGLDVGVYATTGTRMLNIDNYSIGSVIKPFLLNGQFRKFEIENGLAAAAGTPRGGQTFKLITLLDTVDRYNRIYILENPAEGAAYYVSNMDSLIDNRSGFSNFVFYANRVEGDVYTSKNSAANLTFVDNSFLVMKRSATNKFCRIRFDENGTEKWLIDFTNTAGDLIIKRSGQPDSIHIGGSSGTVTLGNGAWDGPAVKIGSQYLWLDANGKIRTKLGAPTADIQGDVVAGYESAWNSDSRLKLGLYHLWVDATGDLRIKGGVPTSDTDGTIVGTQA